MKITTVICDKCKGNKKARSYRYSNGKEMDASGNGYNELWVNIDLCVSCLLQHGRDYPKHRLEDTYV